MSGDHMLNKPKARSEQLVVRDSENEILVYDLKTHDAHCLKEQTAAIWRLCDGQRTTHEIAEAATVSDVDAAIAELQSAGLLTTPPSDAPRAKPAARAVTRRTALQTAALTGIVTITAPRPAQAMSCLAGGECLPFGGSSGDCCSGNATTTGAGGCISGWICT